jgi:hypothetical protein
MSVAVQNNGVNRITKIFSVDREKKGKVFLNRRTQRDAENTCLLMGWHNDGSLSSSAAGQEDALDEPSHRLRI